MSKKKAVKKTLRVRRSYSIDPLAFNLLLTFGDENLSRALDEIIFAYFKTSRAKIISEGRKELFEYLENKNAKRERMLSK